MVKENVRAIMLVIEAMECHVLPERKMTKQSCGWTKHRACKNITQVNNYAIVQKFFCVKKFFL